MVIKVWKKSFDLGVIGETPNANAIYVCESKDENKVTIIHYIINGIESFIKQEILHKQLRDQIDLCLLQETKVSQGEYVLVRSLRGGKEIKWSVKKAMGRSTCILIMWNAETIKTTFGFEGEEFLGIHIS